MYESTEPKDKIQINSDSMNYQTLLMDEPYRKLVYDKKAQINATLTSFENEDYSIEINHTKENNNFVLLEVKSKKSIIKTKIIEIITKNHLVQ